MTEGIFTNYHDINAYILGNMSLVKYSERRLTAKEYEEQVNSKVAIETKELKLMTEALEEKLGSPLQEHWIKLAMKRRINI
jgi:hypothetical protein